MGKKVHHEEHVDETWLIPYADMLTLLLALFIVMFAMSQLDKSKLAKASDQFNIIFAGGSGMLEKDGNAVIPMENSNEAMTTAEKTSKEDDKMNELKKI